MKAILVVDMPKCCDMCPLFYYEAFTCQGVEYGVFNDKWDIERQAWCPLKPMPHSKQIENRWFSGDYSKGWNDCLEELEKQWNI